MAAYAKEKDNLLKRLRRIEGQVRGIQRMIEQDKYCVDILVQIAAARSALDRVGLMLLESHMRGCVTRAIKNDDGEAAVTELTEVVRQFIR